MSRASLLAIVIAAATLLPTASPARANGRFPESNQIAFAAHDPDLVLLRVTFGLLVSHDRGRTFQWVCEQSIGYSGVEDPMYTVTPSNAVIGTTFQGLSVSRDNGCGWTFARGALEDQVFIDLTSNPNDPKNVVVFASSYDREDDAGAYYFSSKLWETKDEANTFEQLGQPLDPGLLGYTVDLTKGDPSRIYATAVRKPGVAPEGVLLVSKDHGATWSEEAVPLINGERALFVAAVDPMNPERVYLRTSNMVDKPTRLILRDQDADAGSAPTQRTLHTALGGLLGFALAPDGSKVYIGGPKDGILVAETKDYVFQQKSSLETQCLALSPDGLWACSTERSGFVAGLSRDEGVTFEPRLRFCDIPGPVATCGPGTATNDRCAPNWPSQKSILGCGGDIGTPGEGGFTDAGPGFAPDGPPKTSGCDCHASPAGPWGAFVSTIGVTLVVGALGRRSRRRRGG